MNTIAVATGWVQSTGRVTQLLVIRLGRLLTDTQALQEMMDIRDLYG